MAADARQIVLLISMNEAACCAVLNMYVVQLGYTAFDVDHGVLGNIRANKQQ